MKHWLATWWQFNPDAEASTADNPQAPLTENQRRDTLPLLTLAFGWGFLITGLIVGGALGIYQQFLFWIDLLASIAPPLVGPLLVDYYVVNRKKYQAANFDALPSWSSAAFLAYAIGAGSTFFAPDWTAKALVGLAVSMLAYFALCYFFNALKKR